MPNSRISCQSFMQNKFDKCTPTFNEGTCSQIPSTPTI